MKIKEWLNAKTYEYKQATAEQLIGRDWIDIPEGADKATVCGKFIAFWKCGAVFFIDSDVEWDFDYGMDCSEYMRLLDDCGAKVIWQRPTQPEPLPFIDDEPRSLNDQYAEIEQVRQAMKAKSGSDSDHALDAMSFGIMGVSAKDNVNRPSHYTQGKVECIDAIESATIGKKGIDAVCVANVIKYLWRYEEKNGLEDIKKAQWYLQKLIENTI